MYTLITYFIPKTYLGFILLLISNFTISLQAQNQESDLTCKLVPGCPKDIEPIKDKLGATNFSYASLETGIDSLNILFGEMTQGETNGYWLSHYTNDILQSFRLISFKNTDESAFFSKKIDIDFDNSSRRISLQVKHKPLSDEVSYIWLDNNKESRILKITNIERPIQKDKKFPPVQLESLDGKSLSVQEFAGKFVVINWWATNCAPCIKEIPGLNKLVEKFKSNQDLVFLSIAYDKREVIEKFLKNNDFMYLQTLGDKKVAEVFDVTFPINLIVNPNGKVVYYNRGGYENIYLDIEKELKKQMNN